MWSYRLRGEVTKISSVALQDRNDAYKRVIKEVAWTMSGVVLGITLIAQVFILNALRRATNRRINQLKTGDGSSSHQNRTKPLVVHQPSATTMDSHIVQGASRGPASPVRKSFDSFEEMGINGNKE